MVGSDQFWHPKLVRPDQITSTKHGPAGPIFPRTNFFVTGQVPWRATPSLRNSFNNILTYLQVGGPVTCRIAFSCFTARQTYRITLPIRPSLQQIRDPPLGTLHSLVSVTIDNKRLLSMVSPRGPQLLKILYKIVQSSGIFRDCKVVMKNCIPELIMLN